MQKKFLHSKLPLESLPHCAVHSVCVPLPFLAPHKIWHFGVEMRHCLWYLRIFVTYMEYRMCNSAWSWCTVAGFFSLWETLKIISSYCLENSVSRQCLLHQPSMNLFDFIIRKCAFCMEFLCCVLSHFMTSKCYQPGCFRVSVAHSQGRALWNCTQCRISLFTSGVCSLLPGPTASSQCINLSIPEVVQSSVKLAFLKSNHCFEWLWFVEIWDVIIYLMVALYR